MQRGFQTVHSSFTPVGSLTDRQLLASKLAGRTIGAAQGDTTKKSTSGWEKPPTIVAKRNARERTRVHTVNQAFIALKCRLPALRANSKRVSKLKILRAAINYIHALTDLLKVTFDDLENAILRKRKQQQRQQQEPQHFDLQADVPALTPFASTFPYVKSVFNSTNPQDYIGVSAGYSTDMFSSMQPNAAVVPSTSLLEPLSSAPFLPTNPSGVYTYQLPTSS